MLFMLNYCADQLCIRQSVAVARCAVLFIDSMIGE